MGEAEVRLCFQLGREFFIRVPKVHNGFRHMLKVECNAPANIAALLHSRDPFYRTRTGRPQSAVANLVLQLLEVTLQCQCHTEAVLADKHHIVVQATEAFPVGLNPDIRLHHGGAEYQLQLILLQLSVQGTQRTSAGCI